MKIAFVIPSMYKGGAERVISILCNSFVSRGNEVSLILTESIDVRYELDSRVKIINIITEGTNYFIKFPKYINKIKNYLSTENVDIVVSFIVRTNIMSIIACKQLGIPVIVSERNEPSIVPASRIARIIRNFIYRFTDGFVAQTKYARNYFSKTVSRKGIIIKNPVSDVSNYICSNEEKSDIIITACRLTRQKNIPLLLKAFKNIHSKIPSYKLYIYGEGEEKMNLIQYIQNVGLEDKVFFKGNIENVIQEVAKAKVFVLPSDFEGLSNSLVEAMCVGTACIATDSPAYGNRELITNGKNGFLVPINDVDRMGTAILSLVLDEKLIKTFAYRSMKVYDEVNSENIVLQWENYIKAIIKC